MSNPGGNKFLGRLARATSHKFVIKETPKRPKKQQIHPAPIPMPQTLYHGEQQQHHHHHHHHHHHVDGNTQAHHTHFEQSPRASSVEARESDNEPGIDPEAAEHDDELVADDDQDHHQEEPSPTEAEESSSVNDPPSTENTPMPSFRTQKRAATAATSKSFVDAEPSHLVNEIVNDFSNAEPSPHTYNLGEIGRKEDMIMHTCFEEKLVAIAQLKERDHAFIWRSNGYWTYAIVVGRVGGPDASLKFVVDDKGHTKEIPLRQWSKFLRVAKDTVISPLSEPESDFMSSTIAINGEVAGDACAVEPEKSEPTHRVAKVGRTRPKLNDRRKSESHLTGSRQRLSKTRQSVSERTLSNDDEVPGILKTNARPRARPILRKSLGQRFSEVNAGSRLRVSWRLSTVEQSPMEDEEEEVPIVRQRSFRAARKHSHSNIDGKFNQQASFLSALASIKDREGIAGSTSSSAAS
ncbi:hypothetical protein ACHAXS_003914 [Conticribra weissflogii]